METPYPVPPLSVAVPCTPFPPIFIIKNREKHERNLNHQSGAHEQRRTLPLREQHPDACRSRLESENQSRRTSSRTESRRGTGGQRPENLAEKPADRRHRQGGRRARRPLQRLQESGCRLPQPPRRSHCASRQSAQPAHQGLRHRPQNAARPRDGTPAEPHHRSGRKIQAGSGNPLAHPVRHQPESGERTCPHAHRKPHRRESGHHGGRVENLTQGIGRCLPYAGKNGERPRARGGRNRLRAVHRLRECGNRSLQT